ncbi:putative mediator of RNA polymerase II transcription subunit 26 isoform X2 [Zeugodacus cucurbitae]|uniref:putative mediator of RNA polymerase II transcription subunit 26 isoform X2 n=1 Tax=Zeugodacus cucurbitae TaxID=28588 RepID=UPI0023D93A1F|nr:putative mediator of RNA polymerase II transcription subunit 26 isoform X2 [Zeugodacus cucurbitae]
MDSTTESKEVKQNEESNNVVEELSTEEVEIEDCSDSSESVVAEPTKIQNTEAEHKVVGSEKQDEEEVVELVGENNSEEEEVEAGNVPSQPEIVIEYDRESANTSPAPTPTATVVIAQQNVAHSKLEDNKENKVLNEGKGEETENAEEANKTVLSEDSVVENKQVESSENTETTISQDQVDAVQPGQSKEENWNNTIKNIISDIDSNIEQENCDLLKQQQKELLQKQQELVQQIRQQQLIAQKLADENRLHQQQLQQQQLQQQQLQQQQLQQQQLQQQQLQQQQLQQQQLQQQQLQQQQLQQQQLQQQQSQPESSPQPKTQNLISTFEQASTPTPSQHKENISKYSTVEETKDEFGYTKNTETYEFKESTNASKHIDLHKIFTPATDNDAVLPRNHSTIKEKNYQEEFKENNVSLIKTTQPTTQNSAHNQVPLRFLMNPLGKVRDITSVSDSFNIETGLLSPDKCAELITALQTQKGKGAELFAKRRRKSEKWVVDDKSARTESPSGLPDYQQQQQQFKPATSPSILPAYSDAGKHRVQLNLHQEQVLEKYVKPGLKVVKTPWEAALETGSASTAFLDDDSRTQQTSTPALSPAPVAQYQYTDPTNIDTTPYKNGLTADYSIAPSQEQSQSYFPTVKPNFGHNPQRELAYKPSLPQGWKAPSPSLPKDDEQIVRYELEVVSESNKTKSEDILNQFMRSPKLRVSPIPTKELVLYKDAILELEDMSMKRQMQQSHNKEDKEISNNKPERLEKLENNSSTLTENVREEDLKQPAYVPIQSEQKKQQSPSQQNFKEHEVDENENGNEETEYVKIAVRDLILNYEQQLVREETITKSVKPNQANNDEIYEIADLETPLADDSELFSEQRKNVDTWPESANYQLRNEIEELYVPKEISLESYAPPPVVISKEPEHYKPSWQQASATTSSASTFPLARPSHGGFRSYAPPNSDRPVQHQTVPQINYNPSPLSYDKIAKFENADEQQAQNNEYNAQTRRLPIRSNVDKVQNIVPAAYQRPANIERLPTTPYQSNLRPTDINVNYNRFPTPVYIKRINPNEILHGQNYNNTARGWKSSGISSYKSPCDNSFKTPNIESCGIYQQVPLTAANTLPYTDF